LTDEEHRTRDVGKLWGAIERTNGDVKALTVALVGMNGDNGLRGELRDFISTFKDDHAVRLTELEDRVEEGIAMGKNMYFVDRHKPGECIGKVALDKYVTEIDAQNTKNQQASTAMKTATMAMIGMIIVSMITSLSSIFIAMQKIPQVIP